MERLRWLGVCKRIGSKAIQMFLSISLVAALVGVGFAGAAAFGPDTGIDGTLGAFLALLGAVALTLTLIILSTIRVSARLRAVLVWLAGLLAILTGLAAWFLMQDALLGATVVSFLALLLRNATGQRKPIL